MRLSSSARERALAFLLPIAHIPAATLTGLNTTEKGVDKDICGQVGPSLRQDHWLWAHFQYRAQQVTFLGLQIHIDFNLPSAGMDYKRGCRDRTFALYHVKVKPMDFNRQIKV